MESLKERISKDYLEAFKARETSKKNILSLIKTNITIQEKKDIVENLSDAGVCEILKKTAKNLENAIVISDKEEDKLELSIVESYLPKQMAEEEIRAEVAVVILEIGAISPSDMGKVMTGFSAKFAGKADNKIVSNIVRELLVKK